MKTEDEIRDLSGKILGFDSNDPEAFAGVGQITTFNQLGFKGDSRKPDGWYLPKNVALPAIILEAKSEGTSLSPFVSEIIRNCEIVLSKYSKCVGILYNGNDIKVFLNNEEIEDVSELQNKEHYLSLFDTGLIDKEHIYDSTARINNCLNSELRIKNLKQRMVFTACALVAERYGITLEKFKDIGYSALKIAISEKLKTSLADSIRQNAKIAILLAEFESIDADCDDNELTKNATNQFIDEVVEISKSINSSKWNGEDVMGIFFNEFNRYKGKSEEGQVFTPDHITSFMYRLIEVNKDDRVLDATCGSGAFLTKAMANMIAESGGPETTKAKEIMQSQLYGIEFDKEIFALACANMLIHKDGKSNITKLDSRTQEAIDWIKTEPMKEYNGSKPITKVLMNPPYEKKYGCMDIVLNVLSSVPKGTMCAFILPDKKLEKGSKKVIEKMLNHHRLKQIVKLPEDLFFNVGVTCSIFVFQAGVPQNHEEIFGCYMKEDGFSVVKNKGRHDVKGTWGSTENYWIDVCKKKSDPKYNTVQWIKPGFGDDEHLSYQKPVPPLELFEEDFNKTVMDYLIYRRGEDISSIKESVVKYTMYGEY